MKKENLPSENEQSQDVGNAPLDRTNDYSQLDNTMSNLNNHSSGLGKAGAQHVDRAEQQISAGAKSTDDAYQSKTKNAPPAAANDIRQSVFEDIIEEDINESKEDKKMEFEGVGAIGGDDIGDEDLDEISDLGQSSIYSHVVSQNPVSEDERRPSLQDEQMETLDAGPQKSNLTINVKLISPLFLYTVLFLVSIVLLPFLTYQGCKDSPQFASHIVYAFIQGGLIILSYCYHRKNRNSSISSSQAMISTQSRCCREIMSHLKRVDTYTNMCFYIIVVHQREDMPIYLFLICTLSMGIYVVAKVGLTFLFGIFSTLKLRKRQRSPEEKEGDESDIQNESEYTKKQKTLIRYLIWLDLDNLAKFYENDESNESQVFRYHKVRFALFKTFIEDLPMTAMQGLYLALDNCLEGLNSLIIVSLYFNSVCILHSLSLICASKSDNRSKVYVKELERLRDYYAQTKVKIVAEFYIEDELDIQETKILALKQYMIENDYDVQTLNISTNQFCEGAFASIGEIVSKSAQSLQELSLSRCRIKSKNLLTLALPPHLVKLDLSENYLGDSSVQTISQYITQKNTGSLLVLNLESNGITSSGAQELLGAIKQSSIVSISLRRNKIQATMLLLEIFKALQLNFLMYLSQNQETKKKEPLSVKITQMEHFERVLLSLFRIDSVQNMKSLDLAMRFSKISRSTPSVPAQQNQEAAHKGLEFYDDEQKVLMLSLQYNACLKKSLPQQHRDLLKPDFFYFANTIQSLNLSSNWFSNKAQSLVCQMIGELSNLKELKYNNNSIKRADQFFAALGKCHLLEKLHLKSCQLGAGYGQALKTSFQGLNGLKELVFSYTQLDDQAICGLAENLGLFKAISKVSMKNCGLTVLSLEPLLDGLMNSPIVIVNISQNDVQGIENLGKFIKQTKNIEKLKLQKTLMGDNELKQISYGLKINKSLTILDLSQNSIKGVGQIKDGLICNVGLQKLDISNNIIDDEGLTTLSQALKFNGSLETISISFNEYQLDGLKAFFSIFEVNQCLTNISLSISPVMIQKEIDQLGTLVVEALKKVVGSFKRFELLGKVKKFKEKEYFSKLLIEGAAYTEELILDSILKQYQIEDMVKGLKRLIQRALKDKQSFDQLSGHKLRKITFIKPQEFSQEIQLLESLLEEKQNLVFVPQYRNRLNETLNRADAPNESIEHGPIDKDQQAREEKNMNKSMASSRSIKDEQDNDRSEDNAGSEEDDDDVDNRI